MTRDEFRQQMKNFKIARENNPQLSYWKWKANKHQDGTDYVNNANDIFTTMKDSNENESN